MGDWLETIAWIGAFALLHEGVALGSPPTHKRRSKVMLLTGALILVVGAGLWFWDALAYHQLEQALRIPGGEARKELSAEQLEAVPAPQRRDASIRWAQAAFVSGGELLSVVTEDGRRLPYSPDSADVKARDRQLKSLGEVQTQRQALASSARLAAEESERWLATLVIALCTGGAARRSRMRAA